MELENRGNCASLRDNPEKGGGGEGEGRIRRLIGPWYGEQLRECVECILSFSRLKGKWNNGWKYQCGMFCENHWRGFQCVCKKVDRNVGVWDFRSGRIYRWLLNVILNNICCTSIWNLTVISSKMCRTVFFHFNKLYIILIVRLQNLLR